MIKTSVHSIKFTNQNKRSELSDFINEYRRCASVLLNYIWSNGYNFKSKDNNPLRFSIKENMLDCPSMLSSDVIYKSGLKTDLTGRALKCCLTQIAGIIGAETEKQRKRLFYLKKKKSEGVSKNKLKQLIKRIKCNIPQKPNVSNINPELNSICADFQETKDGHFDGFVKLYCISKKKTEISIPIKMTRFSRKLSLNGKMKTSFLIKKESFDIRWEIPDTEIKDNGDTLGCDQGYKDMLTFSNGIKSAAQDIHGHSLESIIEKVARKKKCSKAFKRAKDHQKNFVNWSINRINLSPIKEIKFEKIWNITYKRGTSRKLSHWQNTLIRDKMESKCCEEGVRFTLQSSTYMSQRCCECGNVRKANRKGKVYSCKSCGNIIDADLNAAKNHEQILLEIPYELRKLNLNRGDGFFWTQSGYFDSEGRSIQSLPHVEK